MVTWRPKEYISFSNGKLLGLSTGGSWQLHYVLVRNQLHLKEDTSLWVSCPSWGSEETNTDTTQQRWGTPNTSCSSRDIGSQPKASFLNNSWQGNWFWKMLLIWFFFPWPVALMCGSYAKARSEMTDQFCSQIQSGTWINSAQWVLAFRSNSWKISFSTSLT